MGNSNTGDYCCFVKEKGLPKSEARKAYCNALHKDGQLSCVEPSSCTPDELIEYEQKVNLRYKMHKLGSTSKNFHPFDDGATDADLETQRSLKIKKEL